MCALFHEHIFPEDESSSPFRHRVCEISCSSGENHGYSHFFIQQQHRSTLDCGRRFPRNCFSDIDRRLRQHRKNTFSELFNRIRAGSVIVTLPQSESRTEFRQTYMTFYILRRRDDIKMHRMRRSLLWGSVSPL